MAEHNLLGSQGESLAAEFLSREGYTLLDRNWRYGKGEVDIICTKGRFIVFAEVKTRSTEYFGKPEEAVDKKKQRELIKAADAYVIKKNIPLEVRYDILSVIIKQNTHSIRHIEDAFYPTL